MNAALVIIALTALAALLLGLRARAGKNFSYWRHSPPSVAFQAMLAGMP